MHMYEHTHTAQWYHFRKKCVTYNFVLSCDQIIDSPSVSDLKEKRGTQIFE